MADWPVVLSWVSVKLLPSVVVAPASSIVPVDATTRPPADPVPRRLPPVPVVEKRPDTSSVPPPCPVAVTPRYAPPVSSTLLALARPNTPVKPRSSLKSPLPVIEDPECSVDDGSLFNPVRSSSVAPLPIWIAPLCCR